MENACELCGVELIIGGSKNTKAEHTYRTLCLECCDVADFADAINNASRTKSNSTSTSAATLTKTKTATSTSKSETVCSCGTVLVGKDCSNCGKPNPLYRRKNKRH